MKFLKYSVFLIIIGSGSLGDARKKNKRRGLTNYLQKESQLYQVMFVLGDHMMNSTSTLNPLVQEVGKNFPTLSISLSSFRHELIKANYSSALQNPRKTTLFILLLNGKSNETEIQVEFAINQLQHLSIGYPRPKCLINVFPHRKSVSTKKLLRKFSKMEIFDFAVITQSNDNQRFSTTDKLSQLTLHQKNFFSGRYYVQRITDVTEWFPNNLRNLRGQKLKFFDILFHNRLKIFDTAVIKLANLFCHGMNCRSEIMKIESPLDIYKMLKYHQAEVALIPMYFFVANNSDFRRTRMHVLKIDALRTVIPTNSRMSKSIVLSEEFITIIGITVGAIVLLRITAFVLKLNRKTWQMFNISQILMGMSSVNEPEVLSERIILGVLLLTCIAYSSYFYSVILDISWRPQAEITTLKELLDSDLTPMIELPFKEFILISPFSDIQKLGIKSIPYPDGWSALDCLDFLSKYKNVTCIAANVEQVMENWRMQNQKMNMKILSVPLSYYFLSWASRYSSPYIDRFDEIILRASESGIMSKIIISDQIAHWHVPLALEEISEEKLLPLACCLMAVGYTLALVAFIAEKLSILRWSKG